jgi:hypothetical protein
VNCGCKNRCFFNTRKQFPKLFSKKYLYLLIFKDITICCKISEKEIIIKTGCYSNNSYICKLYCRTQGRGITTLYHPKNELKWKTTNN